MLCSACSLSHSLFWAMSRVSSVIVDVAPHEAFTKTAPFSRSPALLEQFAKNLPARPVRNLNAHRFNKTLLYIRFAVGQKRKRLTVRESGCWIGWSRNLSSKGV